MKSECCHQHPENGSDLAVQTEAQTEETNLRVVNAKLLAALWEDKHAHDHANAHCTRCMNAQTKCRDAIKEANK